MREQFIRYIFIGITNTAIDFGLYTVLTRYFDFWRTHYLTANTITFFIVVTWSFFWNKHWTFKNRSYNHLTQYFKFVFATVIGISIANGILFFGVETFKISDIISKIIAGPLVVVWNFSVYRLWTFRSQTTPN